MKLVSMAAVTFVFAAGTAFAGGHFPTLETKSGKTVWTVTDAGKLEGSNNGGKGKTDKAGPGLLKAAGVAGKGKGLNFVVPE